MHRLKYGKHWRFVDGELVMLRAGDVFAASEAEVRAFGERLEEVMREGRRGEREDRGHAEARRTRKGGGGG